MNLRRAILKSITVKGESLEDILNIEYQEVIKDNRKAKIYRDGNGIFPILSSEIEKVELL
ncbi:hypothetical protein [Caloranaerobacter azorensis]|uniref:Uncharacterized protein n=1 Tax=Caloranaerobacter azorensis TaxID=116090 RepID=A0A6P1YCQ0_9FIRM|nr:hypothetical protein [Caloranaerobacter azorensis]QIB27080.1 hypothetical protein G3A45_07125 [Caloranaerobacter azorensis]